MSAGHVDAMAELRKLSLNQFRQGPKTPIHLHAVKPVVAKKKNARRKGKM